MRFLAVGAAATGLQFLILVVLTESRISGPVTASAIGYGVSALGNYLLNYYLTFASRQAHRLAAARFAVVSGIGLAANTLLMFLLVRSAAMGYVVAQIVVTAVITLWSFLAHRSWTYSRATGG